MTAPTRIELNADTALVLFQAMRDTEDGALELTLYDTDGVAVVIELGNDCHAHLPVGYGQAELALDEE
jgi:hypothetical protein